LYENNHEFVNNFIRRSTHGKYQNLYSLVKNESPGEIADYGPFLKGK